MSNGYHAQCCHKVGCVMVLWWEVEVGGGCEVVAESPGHTSHLLSLLIHPPTVLELLHNRPSNIKWTGIHKFIPDKHF